jgi:hypothetical protein
MNFYFIRNVIEDHFSQGSPLKFSSRWDAVECCCVEDIDKDGEQEIIIGTFGCVRFYEFESYASINCLYCLLQNLLVYKYFDEILPEWVVVCKMKFPRPVLAIEFAEPNRLHVVSTAGLHIVNYDTCAYFTNKPGLDSTYYTPTPPQIQSSDDENEETTKETIK